MDWLKDFLVYIGVPAEYHLMVMMTVSCFLLIGSPLVVYLRKLWSYIHKTDWMYIDVQVNRIFCDADSQWHLRFESCGRVHVVEQIGGLLADKLVFAAKSTTVEQALVFMDSPDEQNMMLNKLVSIVGNL